MDYGRRQVGFLYAFYSHHPYFFFMYQYKIHQMCDKDKQQETNGILLQDCLIGQNRSNIEPSRLILFYLVCHDIL